MKRISIRVQLSIVAKDSESYSYETIMERDITATVPPGFDPIAFLRDTVKTETQRATQAFEQFPQHLALTVKDSE